MKPIMCTLPEGAAAQRLAEFGTHFQAALTKARRPAPGRLSLTLTADGARADEIRELVAAEQACCAFLDFTVERTGTGLTVEIEAPPEAEAVLDAWHDLAAPHVR